MSLIRSGLLSKLFRSIRPNFLRLNSNNVEKVIPKFWTGTPAIVPELFTINCENYDMLRGPENLTELANQVLKRFNDIGKDLNINLNSNLIKKINFVNFFTTFDIFFSLIRII